jgi:hypothetical protein
MMELWVIRHEYRDDREAWRLWLSTKLSFPERPSKRKTVVEIVSVVFVAVGIMGELGMGVGISYINQRVRTFSIDLENKSSALRNKSDELIALIKGQAETERLARIKLERQIRGRTIDDPKTFSSELKSVAPLVKDGPVKLSSYMFDVEAGILCSHMADVLTDAGIPSDTSGVGRLMQAGIPLIGIKVLGPKSDKEFMDALAKGLKAHTGFPAEVEIHPNNANVTLWVGSKPLIGIKDVWP